MNKAHSPINWENYPNETTPINEENLNKMDRAIGIIDDRVIEQETKKLSKADASSDIVNVEYDKDTSVFQFTKRNGDTVKVDVSSVVVREGYTKEESDQRYANAIKQTYSGETIVATDSAEAKFEGLRVFGKSEQESTTGAQLLPFPYHHSSGTISGVKFTVKDDGSVDASGVSSNGLNFYFYRGMLKKGTYTISSISTLIGMTLVVYDNVNKVSLARLDPSAKVTFAVVEDLEDVTIFLNQGDAGVTISGTIRLMLNEGTEALPWEKYTDRKPSPSPEYPQPIESVGDDGSVDVGVYGKNLFGGDGFANRFMEIVENASIDTVNGTVYAVAGYVKGKIFFDTFKENTQYTLILKASVRTPGGTSIFIKYTDGTELRPSIQETGVVTTVRVVSEAGKTISRIEGIWQADTTYYYNDFGLFEGVVTLEDFEPYTKQSLTVSTPNGLPAIKVTDASLATYTDAEGNMWCADEVDFARGKYIQRIGKKVLDENAYITVSSKGYIIGGFGNAISVSSRLCPCMSNIRKWVSANAWTVGCFGIDYATFWFEDSGYVLFPSVDDFKSYLTNNPMVVYYILAEPIETDLTAEQLEAYKALHSNYPTTTILNDENAYMEAVLVADTKNHIEQNYVPKSEFLSVVDRVSALEQLALA